MASQVAGILLYSVVYGLNFSAVCIDLHAVCLCVEGRWRDREWRGDRMWVARISCCM